MTAIQIGTVINYCLHFLSPVLQYIPIVNCTYTGFAVTNY